MRSLRLTQVAKDDLVRLYEFIVERGLNTSTPDRGSPEQAVVAMRLALDVLPANPFAGRKINTPFIRELNISFGKTGYVALYEVGPNEITVAAIRHQLESDYH